MKGKLTELDAVKNYGMRDWRAIHRDMETAHPLPKPKSKQEFFDWWDDKVKEHGVGGENFAIADKQGNNILFDAHPHKNQGNFFREHVTDRHEYAWMADQVIQQPDEIWSYYDVRKGKKLVHTYLKYYNGKTLTVVVSEAEGLLKAETIYEVRNAESFTNLRKGVLMHANKKF